MLIDGKWLSYTKKYIQKILRFLIVNLLINDYEMVKSVRKIFR
jgi:hypothetical protein